MDKKFTSHLFNSVSAKLFISFLIAFCFPGIDAFAQNVFSGEPVQWVGRPNGYSTTPYNSDYRTTGYRKISTTTANPADGRGQWATTINVQSSGGDITPDNMPGGGGAGWLLISGPSGNRFQNKWNFGGVGQGALNAINNVTLNASTDMGLDMSGVGYYTFVMSDAGYVNAQFYVGVTANAPVSVTRTSQTYLAGDAIINITTGATPSAGENIYVRYRITTNDFTASTAVVQASGSGSTYAATIPGQPCGTTVHYYVYSSTRSLAQITADSEIDRSLGALRYDDNSGNNYNYTSAAPSAAITNNSGTTIITCTTPSISLTATGGDTYLWSSGATTSNANQSYSAAGTYTVIVTDANGCTASATAVITQSLAGPVHNLNSGLNYCTIQSAINAANANDLIRVDAGIYAENVNINKAIQLVGNNEDILCTSTRGAESIINGGAGTAVTITADNVIINGFQIDGITSVLSSGYVNVTIIDNIMNAAAVGINATGIITDATHLYVIRNNCITLSTQLIATTPTVGIALTATNGSKELTISNNHIANAFIGYYVYAVNTTPRTYLNGGTVTGVMQGVDVINVDNTNTFFAPSTIGVSGITMSGFSGNYPSVPAINFHAGVYGFTGGSSTTASLNVDLFGNTISQTGKIVANCAGLYFADFSTGAGTRITVNADQNFIQNNLNRGIDLGGANLVGSITNNNITNNGFDAFSTGGNDGFGIIMQRGCSATITNNYVSNPASSATSVWAVGHGNAPYATSQVHSNSFSNNSNVNGKILLHTGGTMDATCNWYGTTNGATIASLIQGSPTYIPYLTSGADLNNFPNDGFQPSVACSAPCALVIATATINVSCITVSEASVSVTSGGTGSYTYLWSTAAVTSAITGIAAGTYTVTVTDANGCTALATAVVTGNTTPPSVSATAAPSSICAGNASTLTGSGATTYSWMPGSLSGTTVSVSPGATTTYTVTGTDASNGCTATATVTVTLLSNPIVITSVKSDAALYGGVGTAGVTTQPAGCTYLWSPGGQTTNYIQNQTPGTYTVTITAPGGCTKVQTIIIN